MTAVPSALEHHLGFWLRFVSNHVSRRFESLLGEHGISVTEWVAVPTLYGQSNSTHASLTRGLSMTKGAVSKVVTKLENKGFVDRSFAKTRTIGSFSDTWTAESETNRWR